MSSFITAELVYRRILLHYKADNSVTRLPVIYVFGRRKIDIDALISQVTTHLPDHGKQILLMCDTTYAHSLGTPHHEIANRRINLRTPDISRIHKHNQTSHSRHRKYNTPKRHISTLSPPINKSNARNHPPPHLRTKRQHNNPLNIPLHLPRYLYLHTINIHSIPLLTPNESRPPSSIRRRPKSP